MWQFKAVHQFFRYWSFTGPTDNSFHCIKAPLFSVAVADLCAQADALSPLSELLCAFSQRLLPAITFTTPTWNKTKQPPCPPSPRFCQQVSFSIPISFLCFTAITWLVCLLFEVPVLLSPLQLCPISRSDGHSWILCCSGMIGNKRPHTHLQPMLSSFLIEEGS